MNIKRWIAAGVTGGTCLLQLGADPASAQAPMSWKSVAVPGSAPQGSPPTATKVHLGGAVSAAAAARLRSAGLDPADPQFSAKLAARMASIHSAAEARVAAQPNTAQPAPRLLSRISALAGASRNAVAASRTLTWGGATSTAGSDMARPFARPSVSAAAQVTQTTPWQLDQMYQLQEPQAGVWQRAPIGSNGGGDLRAEKLFAIPEMYVATFNAPEATLAAYRAANATQHYSIPACQVEADWPASIMPISMLPGSLGGPGPGSGAAAGRDNGAVQFGFNQSDLGLNSDLPLGATVHPGIVTLQWNNLRADIRAGFIGGATYEEDFMAIGTDPPFLSTPNALGFGPQQVTFGNPTQVRLNTTANQITGNDTFGIGARLGPGYTLESVKVVQVRSVLDQPGLSDAPIDNPYRGAQVAFSPTAGRIQVTVNWHVGPGDSLEYILAWTFSGPAGQRPVLTMPLRGPCDS